MSGCVSFPPSSNFLPAGLWRTPLRIGGVAGQHGSGLTRGNAMAIWDIAEQPARDQFGYWHDVICEVFIPMTPQRLAPGDGFAGRVEARQSGSVTRTDVRSEPQR